jgi:hypothetical protein
MVARRMRRRYTRRAGAATGISPIAEGANVGLSRISTRANPVSAGAARA